MEKVRAKVLWEKFNLRKQIISKYTIAIRKGILPKENGGRPRCLDNISVHELRLSGQEITEDDIENQYIKSVRRRRVVQEIEDNDVAPMSSRSIRRWLKDLNDPL